MSALAAESAIQITKIKEHIGAEVRGVDLRQPLDAAIRQQIYDALVENVTVVIRDQDLTATHTAKPQNSSANLWRTRIGCIWRKVSHWSVCFRIAQKRVTVSRRRSAQMRPGIRITPTRSASKFTCLYAVELPDSGGGTSVCNMRAAYEALPQEMQSRLGQMETANTLISSARFKIANPDILAAQKASTEPPMAHPLIRTHPDNGTKAIWFHKSKTETVSGLNPQETQDFLESLLQSAIKPEFTYLHEWRLGDMLMIDNRAAMHKAGHDFDHNQHRHLYRTLVRGDRPV